MAKRKAISKKVRFDIFKRDEFTCQYCGAHPPSVILHVDHIIPVKDGGGNEDDNLVTSCASCNLGKSANSLNNIPMSLKEKAALIKESEEQIKLYSKIIHDKKERLDDEAWKIVAILEDVEIARTYNQANFLSINRFLNNLNYYDVEEAAILASSMYSYSKLKSFKYFCGICWNKIKRGY